MPAIDPDAIDASELNRRVTFQSFPAGTQDALGQPVLTPTTVYGPCWAKIEAFEAALQQEPAEQISKVTTRITIRYTSSQIFTPALQIVYVEQGTSVTHVYRIKAVLNTKQRNRKLIFYCYEINESE